MVQLQTRAINYWRDKSGHDIDFVIRNKSNNSLHYIECKFTSSSLPLNLASSITSNFAAFRNHYPDGKNYIVANDIDTPFERQYGPITVSFVNTKTLITHLS